MTRKQFRCFCGSPNCFSIVICFRIVVGVEGRGLSTCSPTGGTWWVLDPGPFANPNGVSLRKGRCVASGVSVSRHGANTDQWSKFSNPPKAPQRVAGEADPLEGPVGHLGAESESPLLRALRHHLYRATRARWHGDEQRLVHPRVDSIPAVHICGGLRQTSWTHVSHRNATSR
jgi:hypothetical protein